MNAVLSRPRRDLADRLFRFALASALLMCSLPDPPPALIGATAHYVPAPVKVKEDCSALSLMLLSQFSRLLTSAALVRPLR